MYKTKKESGHPSDTRVTARCNKAPNPHNYSITHNSTCQMFFWAFIIVACIVIATASATSVELSPIEHKVTYGDTLWGIAKEYKPEDMTMDEYMSWVYDHNDGGMIYPGDTVIMAEVIE